MGAAAANPDVKGVGRGDQGVADVLQFGQHRRVARLHARINLDHALGDFRRHVAGEGFARQQVQQVGAGGGQVEVGQADQLQLEFDAESQRLGIGKRFKRHEAAPVFRAPTSGRAAG
jgi:hypothetical protein